jgi:hypothetical protein
MPTTLPPFDSTTKMLPLKTNARLLLSLVLLFVLLVGSNELRVSVGTIFFWAFGLLIHRRRSHSAKVLRHHGAFGFALLGLLLTKNELFYESTLGRLFDLFFTRPAYDSETPGSGFADWYERFTRSHHHEIDFIWRFLCSVVRVIFTVVALFCLVVLCHWYTVLPQRLPGLTDTIEYHGRTGELPPWLIKVQVQAPEPQPKRDTRYMRLSDDLVFVCGRGGGFERVVAGDYDGAIFRRRVISKEFA